LYSAVEKSYLEVLNSVHKVDGENGYVNLFLLHTASGGAKARKEMYQALEKLLEVARHAALVLAIGELDTLRRSRALRTSIRRMSIRLRYDQL
jgi:hypothetical protein